MKNKIKVAAERLVRHHIYKNMMLDIKGIYESPNSSDLGVTFDDCILCIDCKTLDTKGNSNDIRYTSVEPNQTSFDNSSHKYIRTISNLETRARVSRLPILTYIIKIIYRDDNVKFDISRSISSGKKPSLILVCILNGELSNLFNKDLIFNFKTYKYYSKSNGAYYTPVPIPSSAKDKKIWAENHCISKGYIKITIPQAKGSKDIFFDAARNCYWTYTSDANTKMVRPIHRGDSMRLNNNYLQDRYDAKNNAWLGYIEMDI
ncbi:hypothetical protein NSA24_00185 [Clostridioides mangenotii]|uniref:hypothetical protein n=1 Tax=Metaclostridioides mangenotii TaxID=1540 RepID=UPI002149B30B|nr:hypothetical protein [Clostridioides mangenotii]MCR1953245.1 hypothetical protein [Clostridioides mangenotii]